MGRVQDAKHRGPHFRPYRGRDGCMVCISLWVSVVSWMTTVSAICPSQCFCHEDDLTASCARGKLAVIPIQLNPDVRHMNLSDNQISSVDYSLTFYIDLLNLDLSYNIISSLGSQNFDHQENLKYLNISFNQISRLGKNTFKGLKRLELLDLSHNYIEYVDGSAFKDSVELRLLDLSNNNITFFEDPYLFKNLPNLSFLYLDSNQILDVPSKVLQNLPSSSLEVLSLSNNYIDTLNVTSLTTPSMCSLKKLSLGSNAISNIHISSFNALHSLTDLDLSDNNLTAVPSAQMSKLSQLTNLDLSKNMFVEVPAVAFQSLFHLKVLHLSRMPKLVRIDARAFVDNTHLESVVMDENREMKSLPPRIFHGNLHLRHISIRRNSLRIIDELHFPIDRLQSLDISENPLECNCSLLWFWTLAVQEKQSSEQFYIFLNESVEPVKRQSLQLNIFNLRCDSPSDLRGKLLVDVSASVMRCKTTWLTVVVVTGCVMALFVATCVMFLLLGGDRSFSSCKKTKDPSDAQLSGDSKPLANSLHSGPGPPSMRTLMLDKKVQKYEFSPGQLRYIESCKLVKDLYNTVPNEYTMNMANKVKAPAHFVYV